MLKQYIINRLFMLIPVILAVSIIAFVLIRIAPGDPAIVIAGERANIETIEAIREKYGLNKPLIAQYFIWLKQLLKGDLGRSIMTGETVINELVAMAPNTIELATLSIFFSIIGGMLAGIISASHRYSLLDYGFMGAALIGVSVPVFWLGIILMLIFGVNLRWLPIGGRIDLTLPFSRITGFYLLDSVITFNWVAFKSTLRYIMLPAITLSTIPMATIARSTRSSMLEILGQDFIRTERAKGLPEILVIYKHAVRNALIPVVTVIGLNFAKLLAGSIMTETIFSWPGIGRYVVNSIYARDYPAVQGCILFFAITVVVLNLITDIIYVYIDPRIKY